jgi:hypothetical protein
LEEGAMSVSDFVISLLVIIVFLGSSFFFGELGGWLRGIRAPTANPPSSTESL